MTMPVDTPRREYVEDGVTTVHPIDFKFVDAAEIRVSRFLEDGTEILLVQPTHYSVTGGGYDVGQITKTNGGVEGATIRIDRNTSFNQLFDYIQGDDFSAESHEHGLDRLTMIVQELKRDLLTRDDVRDVIAAMVKAGAGIEVEVNEAGDELTIINSYNAEFIIQTIGAALVGLAPIQVTPDYEAGEIQISYTGGDTVGSLADMLMLSGDQQGGGSSGTGDGSFAEQVRSIIYATLQGVGITITQDDEADTITLTNDITLEGIRDLIGAVLVEGAGITVTEDDEADTITIALSGDAGVSLEQVRDMLADCLSPGTLISIVPDDDGDVIVISTTALDPSYKGLVPSGIAAAFDFADAHNGRALNLTGAAYIGTLKPNADVALSAGWATVIRNNGTAAKTIARGVGVTLYKNGAVVSADASIAVGGVATIQRWAADEFTISGPGVS